jgi:integrase
MGYRDAALFAILMCGLRRAEVAAVEVKDFEPETGAIAVRAGKGQKDRITYLCPGGDEAVADWLKVRGDASGYLINPINKSKVINRDRGFTVQSVFDVIATRAEEAGVRHTSPHDFRRTFISNLLDSDVDTFSVQQLVGHASPATTAKYDRRGEETKRKAISSQHLPYHRN